MVVRWWFDGSSGGSGGSSFSETPFCPGHTSHGTKDPFFLDLGLGLGLGRGPTTIRIWNTLVFTPRCCETRVFV